MARPRIKLLRGGVKELLNSAEIMSELREVGAPVESAARRDPNPEYAESIRMTEHHSQGPAGRGSVRIGATPAFGMAVEAKRGTLARALGEA